MELQLFYCSTGLKTYPLTLTMRQYDHKLAKDIRKLIGGLSVKRFEYGF